MIDKLLVKINVLVNIFFYQR